MRRWFAMIVLLGALGACGGTGEYLLSGDLYEVSCAACHGTDGRGGLGTDIGRGSNTDLALSDEQIAGVITVGPGNMPGFSRFTPEQVDSLVAYVRSLGE
ncbi:MAG: cytochrome c [Actinomycetota bacterium]|nr:cytochrome c [Actinomycetota bacterium]